MSADRDLPDPPEGASAADPADPAPATGEQESPGDGPARRSRWRRIAELYKAPWWAAVGGVLTLLLAALAWLFPVTGEPTTGPPTGVPAPTSAKPVGPPSPGATANPDEVPFGVSLVYDQNHVDNGAAIPGCGGKGKWVFPQDIGTVPQPSKITEMDETWAHQNGGVDYGETNFKLVIQGRENSAVNLIGIRLVDVQKSPGIAGPVIVTQLGCGEPDKGSFKIILDPPQAGQITAVAGHDFPFTTSDDDIGQLQIKAGFGPAARPEDICGCLISWRLAIDWAYKGQLGPPLIIDNQGKPFQTQDGARLGVWIAGTGRWERAE
ncbi:hypothetical protein [Catellatospora paridis]|uniref:hypothetical protein n=1 Tax=Catellatospora paridis TaxID=1617086 RepID=UPI0012D3B6CA|nr:hypothetical protein [Catellatospora paridis]